MDPKEVTDHADITHRSCDHDAGTASGSRDLEMPTVAGRLGNGCCWVLQIGAHALLTAWGLGIVVSFSGLPGGPEKLGSLSLVTQL